ncbi:hypothetical protein H6F96_24495 [Microcoleus sp. FACHB-53]|nr:hypothetical protein [Microcoleus sp. FACHB-53]
MNSLAGWRVKSNVVGVFGLAIAPVNLPVARSAVLTKSIPHIHEIWMKFLPGVTSRLKGT